MQPFFGFPRICRKIGDVEIYALYPESFGGENLAIRKVFAFSDSVYSLAKMCSLAGLQFSINQPH